MLRTVCLLLVFGLAGGMLTASPVAAQQPGFDDGFNDGFNDDYWNDYWEWYYEVYRPGYDVGQSPHRYFRSPYPPYPNPHYRYWYSYLYRYPGGYPRFHPPGSKYPYYQPNLGAGVGPYDFYRR